MAVPKFPYPGDASTVDLAEAIEHLNSFVSSLKLPISPIETGERRRQEYLSVKEIAEWIHTAADSLAETIDVRES